MLPKINAFKQLFPVTGTIVFLAHDDIVHYGKAYELKK